MSPDQTSGNWKSQDFNSGVLILNLDGPRLQSTLTALKVILAVQRIQPKDGRQLEMMEWL